jgi:hypothetical protein
MSGLNKVILIGRLGRNPDIHATQSGKKCASFSIATTETWVQNGNKEEKTVVEAVFKIRNFDLQTFFNQYELDFNEETIIRREISAQGKSRAFINDTYGSWGKGEVRYGFNLSRVFQINGNKTKDKIIEMTKGTDIDLSGVTTRNQIQRIIYDIRKPQNK